MEKNDGSSSKGMGDVQVQGGSSAKRIKCSIEEDAFCCEACTEPLRPPIFQCAEGLFFCSSCCDDDHRRSLGMERAVESILVDCDYAEHGCTEKTAYCYHAKHRWMCPHAPCECPDLGCGFAVKRGELLDHLTARAGPHKWPSTTFQYWVPFDLRIVEPGTHVLCSKNDGQLFLVIVQAAAEPPGLAVSLVSVEHLKPTETRLFPCSVSFSCSRLYHGTSTWWLGPPRFFGSRRPICVWCPKVSVGPDDAGIVLTVNISCVDAVDEEDDLDDSSYVDTDEDMAMSDEDDRGTS